MGAPANSPPLVLGVGEVARRSGVAVSTVHFYQAKGLIAGWRSSGNQRRFPRGVLRRIAFIRVAQRAGVPLSEIRTVLSSLPHGRAPSQSDGGSCRRNGVPKSKSEFAD
jgi:MerR family redox-sensitive transcriptional activator SoxR